MGVVGDRVVVVDTTPLPDEAVAAGFESAAQAAPSAMSTISSGQR